MTTATQTPRLADDAQRGSHSVQRLVGHHGRTHLDLFSGIGGFALAARAAGFQTIGFSEIDQYASQLLAQNFPGIRNYGDIRNVRGVRADLVTGGFPCQPYSLAGERRGASDDRALWPEMLRVIDEAKPRWVLGENVTGIISMELDRVLSDLESIGYSAWALAIPACGLDARHRRERVWIVADSERAERRAHDDGGRCAEQGQDCERQEAGRAGKCGALLADTMRPRSHAGAQTGIHRGQESAGTRDVEFERPSRWEAEPELGRVADGIPNRGDRLKGLGNAIVPQVAAEILKNLVMANDKLSHGGRNEQ